MENCSYIPEIPRYECELDKDRELLKRLEGFSFGIESESDVTGLVHANYFNARRKNEGTHKSVRGIDAIIRTGICHDEDTAVKIGKLFGYNLEIEIVKDGR